MQLNNPAVGLELNATEVQVFTGTTPTAWQDLSLAAQVGVRQAFVWLKLMNNQPTVRSTAFRKNGDTDEQFIATPYGGAGDASVNNVFWGIVGVWTDAAGIVEWKCFVATAGSTVDLVGWIA